MACINMCLYRKVKCVQRPYKVRNGFGQCETDGEINMCRNSVKKLIYSSTFTRSRCCC